MSRIKLEDIERRSTPFKTPEGYFEDLPMRVQARVVAQTKPQERLTLSWSWRRTALWTAAACTIGLLVWITYPAKQYSLGEETLAQVSDEAIVGYLKESDLTNQDLTEQTQVAELYQNDEVLLQQLNIDEEALQNALETEDIEEEI
jgi:hypothetical protein